MKILVADEYSSGIGGCDIHILKHADSVLIIYTDSSGIASAGINGTTPTALEISCPDFISRLHQIERRATPSLDCDTLELLIQMEPQTIIYHGFTRLSFDHTFGTGRLTELADTFRIYRDRNALPRNQIYTRIQRIAPNTYRLWQKDMSQRGVPGEDIFKYNMTVELISADRIRLSYRDRQKIYRIRGIKTGNIFYYELIAEN